ncbi:hypothetical protein [Neisseria subflava]|uniref:hypothetical protein n=1 Tax=Neisseria subflava TaxID=28449 RepID=UPI002359ED33|nr:hypothetical protein [Neisseria sp. KH1003-01]
MKKILKWVAIALGGLFVIGLFAGNSHQVNNNQQGKGSQQGNTAVQKESVSNGENTTDAKVEKEQSNWNYGENKDEMRNQTSHWASIQSENTTEFDFPYNGGSKLEITIRKNPEYGNDLIIGISKGQFTCGLGCKMKVKFDDGDIQTFNMVGSDSGNHDIIFINGSKSVTNFTKNLKKSKKAIIEVEFFQAGARQFKFDVSGLKWEYF